MKARVFRPDLPKGRRILAISDIHGNLSYFRALLDKVTFCEKDILILLGDFLEKGPQSLDTLRFIMELTEKYTVWPVCGNCDGWHSIYRRDPEEMSSPVREYLNEKPQALLSQMCAKIGFPVTPDMDIIKMRDALREPFRAEFEFLENLPHIIDTPHYTFVHGGLPEGRLDELDAFKCMKNDCFMHQGRHFDKWCIVGHWPVMLYGENITCANPIIDRESRIISIDGGCVLKDDGQLNALIIPDSGSEDFDFISYDHFPKHRVCAPQQASPHSYYIRWGDNTVRVLNRGDEFSLCEHMRTGYRMEILNKYLYSDEACTHCNDCTDYVLPLEVGDTVSVVEKTGHGYLVKHKGVSGWYFGRLE